MFVGDMIAAGFLVGGSSVVVLSKAIKTKVFKEDAEQIEKNGLYHFTSEEAAEKIIESGYIKPSNNIMSYGKKACFMFNGIPDVQNYVKNCGLIDDFMKEEGKVLHAVKLNIPREEVQNHYLVRPLNDNAIMFEGKCCFDDNRAKHVQIGLDVRTLENGKHELYFRERTEEEIRLNPAGIPSEELKQAFEEYRKEHNYFKSNGLNKVVNVLKGVKSESAFIVNGVKSFLAKRKAESIDESVQQKYERLMDNGILAKDTPVHDEKYAQNKLDLRYKGLKPIYVKEALENLKTGKNAKLLERVNQLDTPEDKYKAMLAMLIVQQGDLRELNKDENLDILLTSMGKSKENLSFIGR